MTTPPTTILECALRPAWASVVSVLLLASALFPASAAVPERETPEPHPVVVLTSLKKVALPPIPGLTNDYIRDLSVAIRLGKSLFWDMKAGSDGMACASCHYFAGADNRTRNQMNPGLNGGNGIFDPTFTGGRGPNHKLTAADFPFLRLADPTNRESAILFESDDVVSSSGVFPAEFLGVDRGAGTEVLLATNDVRFQVGSKSVRRVEPRNTPTVINAAFNHRNFWDGRANNIFNGVNPFGARDTNAGILVRRPNGSVETVRVALTNSSLASQACGPPLSDFEMSARGKSFPDLGAKLIPRRALEGQKVEHDDSVLGPYRHGTGLGLTETYEQLIQQAFDPRYWSAPGLFPQGTNRYSQMEINFSLFWGLAIMVYERTLVSDDSPVDRFLEGEALALTSQQQIGFNIFRGQGRCINCHDGALFTKATVVNLLGPAGEGLVERMPMVDLGVALYDSGFYNIGVRPTSEDRGLGGQDPFGNPLSFAGQYLNLLKGLPAPDLFRVDPCQFEMVVNPLNCTLHPNPWTERTAVDGAFKTPTLRNVELTGPYFHNGGYATLEQVVEFYNRGGNRRRTGPASDTSGFGAHGSNLDPDLENLGLNAEQQAALVAFLRALTDSRVRWETAPFDHPQLFIPNGHRTVDGDGDGRWDDDLTEIPAVGAGGRVAEGLPPLRPFLE